MKCFIPVLAKRKKASKHKLGKMKNTWNMLQRELSFLNVCYRLVLGLCAEVVRVSSVCFCSLFLYAYMLSLLILLFRAATRAKLRDN